MKTTLPTVLLLVLSSATSAAELDLFVTDYAEDPTPEQRPLVERPVSYASPQRVTIKTSDGREVTYDAPRRTFHKALMSGSSLHQQLIHEVTLMELDMQIQWIRMARQRLQNG